TGRKTLQVPEQCRIELALWRGESAEPLENLLFQPLIFVERQKLQEGIDRSGRLLCDQLMHHGRRLRRLRAVNTLDSVDAVLGAPGDLRVAMPPGQAQEWQRR